MKRLAFLLLTATLLAAVGMGPSLGRAADAHPLHELTGSRPERTFAPRLSITTPYHACTPLPARPEGAIPRHTCAPPGDAPAGLDELIAAESSNPDSLRASALAAIIWWDEADPSLDDAIERLTRALHLSPRWSPRYVSLLVDLSAAYLVRAQRTQTAQNLIAGLEYALQAQKQEPDNAAALFNAALALEYLALDDPALRFWDAYLAADPATGWADEARSHRDALLKRQAPARARGLRGAEAEVQAFADRHPQEARLLGWDHVLGAWGAAMLRGDSADATSQLQLAERLGQALERRNGDATLADAVRAIHAAAADLAATRTLARAHRAYAAGQALYADYQHAAAADSFTAVIDAGPPSAALVQWAQAFHGGTQVYLNELQAANSTFNRVLSTADSLRHPALAARVRWMRSTLRFWDGKLPEARAGYEAAGRSFSRLGEREFYGTMVYLAGEVAYEQSDTFAAYGSMRRAQLVLRPYRGSVWLHNLLLVLARSALKDGMPMAAALIQDESVAVAARSGRAHIRVESLMARARLRATSGYTDLALQDVNAAAPLVERLRGETARKRFGEVFHVSRALAEPANATLASTDALDSAIEYFTDNNVVWLLPALMRRADMRLARGDLPQAAADLDAATLRIRELPGTAELRAAAIEQARSRFDQLVMLHVRAGSNAEALQALEQGRISFVPASDARRREVGTRSRAPLRQVAVEYALIGDTVLTWTVRDTAVHLHRQVVDRTALLQLIHRVGAALETPARAAHADADLAYLYDVLIRPVRGRLSRGTPLVILADGEIASVPFAALLDAPNGRYLLDDHTLRFAPTLADARRPRPAYAPGRLALLVAGTAFDRIAYPRLDSLEGALAETDSLERIYPHSRRLTGPDATREALAALAPGAGVIHYAGHAVFDDTRPERSFLLLAGADTSGRFTAEAVSRLRLGGVRLVVLSACGTLRSRQGRSGAFAGLSGALMAAGAGGVVGSLWQVDDRLAQPLMLAFHREYQESGDSDEALRRAQLELRNSTDPHESSPAAWAGFRYAGR
ncbi:CHAT domain-containing protein [Longimicrobium sp.]|uniref:CHAT domain-containing protein n=1 Tax=Longimicrobium sp. TaxID=2029185 RepID=UPI003B3A0768